jgi:nucleoside-diphosphate-sugar epimerase
VTIRWITPRLGTAPWTQTTLNSQYTRLDVRDIIDGPGNDIAKIREKVEAGVRELVSGIPIVVCCDWGASRSNAIAAGILSRVANISISEAFQRVVSATGERDIKADMYDVVGRALGSTSRARANRRIAVLGGHGVLGRRWAEHHDPDTVFVSRHEIDLLGDLTGGASRLNELGVTDLVALAQPKRPFGRTFLGETLAMTYGALELARTVGARLVVPSSIAVFGGAIDRACLTPDFPMRPTDDLGFAKVAAETLARDYAESRGVQLLVVRFAHLYGAGNRRPTVLVNALERVRRNDTVSLRRFCNGLPELDLLSVDDGVRALRSLVRSDRQGIAHVGANRSVPVGEIIELLISLAGSTSDIRFESSDSETRRHSLHLVGDDPLSPSGPISLHAGLKHFLEQSQQGVLYPGTPEQITPAPLMETL